MFSGGIRASRAHFLAPLLSTDSEVSASIDQAERTWLDAVAPSLRADPYVNGLIVYYDLLRRAKWPVAWQNVHAAATTAITEAHDRDPAYAASVMASASAAVVETLTSLHVMTELGLATEQAPGYVAAKVLCDAYHDLFEGCLPPLARILIPLRQAGRPGAPSFKDLDTKSARELYERLASGRRWIGLLGPFDPFYRNGIAHRATQIAADGTLTIRALDGVEERHLSWAHLVSLVTDAANVIQALLAAIELSEYRPFDPFDASSVESVEAVEFHVAPLGQTISEWDLTTPGMLSIAVSGPRCGEAELLQALLAGFRYLDQSPECLFVKFRNGKNEDRGFWSVDREALAAAKTSIDGIEKAISDSNCYQLRL